MGSWKRNKTAFTLIELLVVVIIVAILAAVGIPLLSANIIRARESEGNAGLGTLRTGMRARLAELGTFSAVPTFVQIGINPNDLRGRFFDDPAYSVVSASGTNYCLSVNGAASTAPKHLDVQGSNLIQRSMDQDGSLFANLTCTAPAIN